MFIGDLCNWIFWRIVVGCYWNEEFFKTLVYVWVIFEVVVICYRLFYSCISKTIDSFGFDNAHLLLEYTTYFIAFYLEHHFFEIKTCIWNEILTCRLYWFEKVSGRPWAVCDRWANLRSDD